MRSASAFPRPPGGGYSGVNVPYTIDQWAVPFLQPASHTMGNNGALSALATALNVTYPGMWIWMATSQIFSGSTAGWYWFVPSGTTAGTVFNSTYTTGHPGIGTTTAFVSTGPGANTGTTVEVFGPAITVKGNSLGPSGFIITNYHASANAGSAKVYRVRYSGNAGTIVTSQSPTNAGSANIGWIQNNGVTNKQVASNNQIISADTIITSYPAVDTTADSSVVFSINKSAAADNAVIERGFIQVAYGA